MAHRVEAPALKVTAPVPLPPLAVSIAVLPYVRVVGALTMSVAWFAFWSVTTAAAELATLWLSSVALDAVTEQVPLAFVTESWSPARVQPVEAPALKVTAPVPLTPPEDS